MYGELLPRTPLRFLLADDPGAGKTIMAGLYIKELLLRDDVKQCLIVAPGGLVEQWQDELFFKFGLRFDLLTNQLIDANVNLNVFETNPLLIARMDQLSRNEQLQAQLKETEWDLIIVDEAHRMGAHYFGGKLEKTKRFQLGEMLGDITRHLLLMTATPHSGKEEDFQLFLTLLDRDRFEGKSTKQRDINGVMRRMVKEDLLTFEGKKLFPERIAETVPYELTALEYDLYEDVTHYVREGMNRAESSAASARTPLASPSPCSSADSHPAPRRSTGASYAVRSGWNARSRRSSTAPTPTPTPRSTSARPRLRRLQRRGDRGDRGGTARRSHRCADGRGAERRTDRARRPHQDGQAGPRHRHRPQVDRTVHDPPRQRAHHRRERVAAQVHHLHRAPRHPRLPPAPDQRHCIGKPDAVTAIHGGVRRGERRLITEEFTKNRDVQILLATDAAGEGLNLQAAHLMVNYDLPWNPNRIEQRFGRIHRIGQEEVCRLWNLVASNTREGEVFTRLLEKLDQMRQTYGGKVFDVLGEAFNETPLRNLLLDAIQYGERPDVKAKMHEVIDASVGDGLKDLLDERALASDHLAEADLQALRAAMDEARARRLQPHYIELAFKAAFTRLGGRIVKREQGRYEIANVPAHIRAASKGPIATKYDRVTFDLARSSAEDLARADLLAPGHPLHDAVMDEAIRQFGGTLNRGTVLVSSTLGGAAPARRRGRGSRRRHRRVRRTTLRLRLRRQLRHRHPSRTRALPRLRRRTRKPGHRRRPYVAMARRCGGHGDELDHRQPVARIPRRGPAATRSPN